MRRALSNVWRFFVDLCVDGAAAVSVIAPVLSIGYTLAKFYDVPIEALQKASYAWGLLPLAVWFLVAYVRRRARTDRAAKIEKLQEFYVRCGPLIKRKLAKDISDEDFNAYKAETNLWTSEALTWIDANLGLAARERVLDSSGFTSVYYSIAVNDTHNTILTNLNNWRTNIRHLIETNAWDRQ